jgi:hypothetical protein
LPPLLTIKTEDIRQRVMAVGVPAYCLGEPLARMPMKKKGGAGVSERLLPGLPLWTAVWRLPLNSYFSAGRFRTTGKAGPLASHFSMPNGF